MTFKVKQKVLGNLVSAMQDVQKQFRNRHTHPFEDMGQILVSSSIGEARTWLEIAEGLNLQEEINLAKELYDAKQK